jgi:predicted nucleotidyltransferase
MPVRSLSSSVLVWPDRETVDHAVREWARGMAACHPETILIGYYGSYARRNWGVGSDVDILVIVEMSSQSFERRSLSWDATTLPVPADVAVYTRDEWLRLQADRESSRKIAREVVWVYERQT